MYLCCVFELESHCITLTGLEFIDLPCWAVKDIHTSTSLLLTHSFLIYLCALVFACMHVCV